jgi:hypothetical protein
MNRRKIVIITVTMLLAMALATAGMAADPIIGTWKLNVSRSKGSPYKEQMEVYREVQGNQIELTVTSTGIAGESRSLLQTFPAQGGVVKVLRGDRQGRFEIETLIAPGEWCMSSLQDGKQQVIRHKIVSKDGREMRTIIKGVDLQGKAIEVSLMYERQ